MSNLSALISLNRIVAQMSNERVLLCTDSNETDMLQPWCTFNLVNIDNKLYIF